MLTNETDNGLNILLRGVLQQLCIRQEKNKDGDVFFQITEEKAITETTDLLVYCQRVADQTKPGIKAAEIEAQLATLPQRLQRATTVGHGATLGFELLQMIAHLEWKIVRNEPDRQNGTNNDTQRYLELREQCISLYLRTVGNIAIWENFPNEIPSNVLRTPFLQWLPGAEPTAEATQAAIELLATSQQLEKDDLTAALAELNATLPPQEAADIRVALENPDVEQHKAALLQFMARENGFATVAQTRPIRDTLNVLIVKKSREALNHLIKKIMPLHQHQKKKTWTRMSLLQRISIS